ALSQSHTLYTSCLTRSLLAPHPPTPPLFPYTTLFRSQEHPRLAAILQQTGPVRFSSDSPLPDPYDGLVENQHGHLDIHDCLGCRSEEHTSELQSREKLVCRLLLEKKKIRKNSWWI